MTARQPGLDRHCTLPLPQAAVEWKEEAEGEGDDSTGFGSAFFSIWFLFKKEKEPWEEARPGWWHGFAPATS